MRDWTNNEFEILLSNTGLPAGRLAVKAHHAAAIIMSTSIAVHAFHLEGNNFGMSSIMLARLALGDWTCPVCGVYFPPARR